MIKHHYQKIFNETAQHNFSDLTINEFFIQLRANTLGKSKILNCHHYFRQRGTSQISNHFDFTKDVIKIKTKIEVIKTIFFIVFLNNFQFQLNN